MGGERESGRAQQQLAVSPCVWQDKAEGPCSNNHTGSAKTRNLPTACVTINNLVYATSPVQINTETGREGPRVLAEHKITFGRRRGSSAACSTLCLLISNTATRRSPAAAAQADLATGSSTGSFLTRSDHRQEGMTRITQVIERREDGWRFCRVINEAAVRM